MQSLLSQKIDCKNAAAISLPAVSLPTISLYFSSGGFSPTSSVMRPRFKHIAQRKSMSKRKCVVTDECSEARGEGAQKSVKTIKGKRSREDYFVLKSKRVKKEIKDEVDEDDDSVDNRLVNHRYRALRLIGLFKSFSEEQRSGIDAIGFGGLIIFKLY